MSYTKDKWIKQGSTISAFGRGIIAKCPLPQDGGVMEVVANAHLIVAAPDLYEACLSALGVMATLDQGKGWVKEISGVIQKALAKAL